MERLTFREGVCPVGSCQSRSVVVVCLITWWFHDAAGKYRAIGVSVRYRERRSQAWKGLDGERDGGRITVR